MTAEDDLATERTRLLRAESSTDVEILVADKPNLSPFEINRTQLIVAVGFTWLASFLAALDSTITSTLSATIASEFGSLAIISWLGSAYLIAHAVVQPLSGKLTDIFGRRAGLIFCSVLFLIGNALCGIASTKAVLILGRVAAGLGGGGLNSISTFVLSDLVPLRSRGLWQGLGNVVYAVGLGLGGMVGGGISDVVGWTWAFLVLTPLTVVSGCGMWWFLPAPRGEETESVIRRVRRIDFAGSMLLTAALALLLWGLNFESDDDSLWRLMLAITVPISVLLLLLFVMVEAWFANEPIIPMSLLRNRTVAASCLAGLFESMAMYILMFFIPLYLQLSGLEPGQVGLLMTPEPIGGALGSLVSGIIMRVTGTYGVLKTVVLVLFIAGPAGFASSFLDTPVVLPETYLFFTGLGYGGMLTVMLLAVLGAVDHEMQAIATGMQYAFRASGATIGISVAGMVFRLVLASNMPTGASRNLDGNGIDHSLRDCSVQDRSDAKCSLEMLEAYMHALRAVFLLALAFGITGFGSGMLTRNFRLHTTLDRKHVN